MITAISLRNDLKANGMSMSKKNREVMARFQSGIQDGMQDYVNRFLATAHEGYFVDDWRGSKKNSSAKHMQYTEFSGANKLNKKKKKVFVKGKIVNRTGQMAETISPVTFTGTVISSVGTNKSPDMKVVIQNKQNGKEATIRLSGRTGMLMGIHINKSKIRILMNAANKTSRNVAKIMKAGIESKMKSTGVVK